MTDYESPRMQERACPKRLWVLSVLSDDEAMDTAGELPQGLRFHLSQCAPCRALADSMLAVTSALGARAEQHVPYDLSARADEQLARALRAGARLTGRVSVPEEAVPQRSPRPTPGWPRLLPYAAAASILLGWSLLWLRPLSRATHQVVDERGRRHQPIYLPAVTPMGEEAPEEVVVETVEGPPEGRLVTTEGEAGTKPAARLRICRDRSYTEAALSEDLTCFPRAIVLPDPAERARWRRPGPVDRPPYTVSTTPEPDPR